MNNYNRRRSGKGRSAHLPENRFASRLLGTAHRSGPEGVMASVDNGGVQVVPMPLLAAVDQAVKAFGLEGTVVYQGHIHGVAMLREFVLAVLDLPEHVHHARDHVFFGHTPQAAIVRIPREMAACREGEGPDVSVARPLKVVTILAREEAVAMFDRWATKPERLWPLVENDYVGFAGVTGPGYTALTLDHTLEMTWKG